MPQQPLRLSINGHACDVVVEPHWTLLHVLRTQLGLLGTKENCLEAECGVCTVLIDGQAMNACIALAAQMEGRAITTIEGLGTPDDPHPLQAAFVAHGAVQCGYCIPGMILTAKSFLDEHAGRVPTRDEVREAISGTLCRCTGYGKIIDAIMAFAEHGREARA